MDVDHVDPHLLDQVRLPAREHGESVARIVAELLRPGVDGPGLPLPAAMGVFRREDDRSEEHTSELQSQSNLVCRLLLEKKKHSRTEQHYRNVCRLAWRAQAKHPFPC